MRHVKWTTAAIAATGMAGVASADFTGAYTVQYTVTAADFGGSEVTVNGTVHKVSSLSLEAAPEELTFTARLEAVLVHQETLSPGYQLFQAEEGCGADWRTGSEAISF